MKSVKILGVHGLGDHRNSTWKEDWTAALTATFPGQPDIELKFSFLAYDDIFEGIDLSVWETMQAVWKLARSGVTSGIRGRRGVIGDVSDRIRWTAGYIVAWLSDEGFKRRTRQRVLDTLVAEQPDLILAHSLGSLVTYNAFTHPDAGLKEPSAALARARYVTLGSQLGNPFVVGNLTPGRLEPLPVRFWHHLFNEEDDVFTAPIQLWDATNFRQVETPFDIPGFADHAATEYLGHRQARENVWRPVAEEGLNPRLFRAFGAAHARRESPAVLEGKGRTRQRALLVGINRYPQQEDRLEGCVNDVFLMSSVLQECGFPAESIRVCLDERATTAGIKERLKWLLDDPRKGDQRVFFYSGHGATIPQYGEDFEPDRKSETLVPYDFDWSAERAIVDDEIFALYSQLPYDTRFAMILDCCHAGGMHRAGGPRVRGLNPPDDIRHRELRWSKEFDMWVPRKFEPLNGRFSPRRSENIAYFGEDRTLTRLGRASLLRTQTDREYQRQKRRERAAPVGPYLPLILEACGEKQFSYEYRHGVTSYGAFTYALALELRARKRITFKRLVKVTTDRLQTLRYAQTPQILGPRKVLSSRVPWTD